MLGMSTQIIKHWPRAISHKQFDTPIQKPPACLKIVDRITSYGQALPLD